MDLWSLLGILVVLGFVAWILQQGWVPIGDPFKQIILIVLVILAVVALFQFFGIVTWLKGIKAP